MIWEFYIPIFIIVLVGFPHGAGRIVPEADTWRFEFDGDEILNC